MVKTVFVRFLRIVGIVVAVLGGFFFILSVTGYFTPALSEGGGSTVEGVVVNISLALVLIFGLLCYWISGKILGIPLMQDQNSGQKVHFGRILAVLAIPILVFIYIFATGYGFI